MPKTQIRYAVDYTVRFDPTTNAMIRNIAEVDKRPPSVVIRLIVEMVCGLGYARIHEIEEALAGVKKKKPPRRPGAIPMPEED